MLRGTQHWTGWSRRRWEPVNLPGLIGDFSADHIATGAVSSWTNLKPGGVAPAQATGSKQPTNTANQINGHNAVVFGGTSDTDDFLTVAATLTQPFHVFTVCQCTAKAAATNQDMMWSFSATSGLLVDSTPRSFLWAGTLLAMSPQLALASSFTLLEGLYNGASSSLIETTSSGSTTRGSGNAGSGNGTSITLGGFPAGTHTTATKIARFIVVSGEVTGSNLVQTRDYLVRRYGL